MYIVPSHLITKLTILAEQMILLDEMPLDEFNTEADSIAFMQLHIEQNVTLLTLFERLWEAGLTEAQRLELWVETFGFAEVRFTSTQETVPC